MINYLIDETFTLDLKPMSINSAYSNASRGRIKTEKYKNFEDEISWLFISYSKELRKINEVLRLGHYAVSIKAIFLMPTLTKKGLFSKNKGDVTNYIKTLEDCLFNELEADDSQVKDFHALQVESSNNKIILNIKLFTINDYMTYYVDKLGVK